MHTHPEVHALSTVGDNTQETESFGQILGGLCLACTSRTSRGTTKLHGQGLGEGQVDSVDEETVI